MNEEKSRETPIESPEAAPDVVAAFEELDTDQIPSTDIVFECPHCGKSLSIDQRGAGLVIECTACHELVTVPIPEGMVLSDIDLPPEEQETQLSNMRVMLSKSEESVAKLTAENQTLTEKVESLSRAMVARARRQAELRTIYTALAKSHAETEETLSRLRRFLDEND